MPKPRLLLADDHRIVIEGLKRLLGSEFTVVGTVTTGRALVAAAAQLAPDVVVADVSMPELNGIGATRHIMASARPCPIVLLTMHPDVTYATRALDAGACGYVLKHAAPAELVHAIREALAGRVFVSPSLPTLGGDSAHRRQRPTPSVGRLTPRQREVLQLVAEGRSAREVGSALGLSPRTVEHHKYRMMKVLGVRSSAELIQYAVVHGISSRQVSIVLDL